MRVDHVLGGVIVVDVRCHPCMAEREQTQTCEGGNADHAAQMHPSGGTHKLEDDARDDDDDEKDGNPLVAKLLILR